MDDTTQVTVHESVRPEAVRKRILAALNRSELDSWLLYSGVRQSSNWVELHHGVSPAQRNAAVFAMYEKAFASMAERVRENVVQAVSLACGDGSKDIRCLNALRQQGRSALYTPADFSLELV